MAAKKISASSRVLLIQNDKASLYAWKKQQLLKLGDFNATDNGLQAFIRLLNQDSSAVSVVVDCIEEDFRHETLAHVQGKDRMEMLKRKESLLFRNTPYRIARLLGRESTGRRDDKFLFSALTKPELVNYWLDPVLDSRISVRAITSASYLMEQLARQEGLHKQDHVLLVSVENLSGIRQTYLQKGKLMFSRLLPMRTGQNSSVSALIEEQAIQTRKYLERIKLLPYEEALDAVVYLTLSDKDTAEQKDVPDDHSSEQMNFIYRDASTLDGHDQVDTADETMRGCLLPTTAFSLKKSSLANTYGKATDRRYHFFSLASKGLLVASIALVILTLLTTTPMLLEGRSNSEQAERLRLQTGPLLNDYEHLRQSFPETPIASNSMALIVETYDKLATEVVDPRTLMNTIGYVLSASPNVRLSKLEWAIAEQSISTDINLTDGQRYIQSSIDNQMQITALIEGNVLETFSVREAHEQVTGFMATLERETGGVVTPVSLPLDISAVSSLELTLDDAPVAAGFILELKVIPASQFQQQATEDGI